MSLQKLIVKAAFAAICLASAGGALAQGVKAPKQEKLLNGMKLLMWKDPSAANVTIKVRIHSGAAFDPQGKEGAMALLSEAFFPVEAGRTFYKEDLGGNFGLDVTYDYIQVTVSSKPADFLTLIESAATAISNPTTDKETVARLRDELLKKVRSLGSDRVYIARMAAAQRLFGTFPYGRPILGTEASLAKLDFADIIDAKQRFLTADNATVSISGNFDETVAYRAARRFFGSWLKSDKLVPSTFKQPDPPDTKTETITFAGETYPFAAYALRSLARNDKDHAAAEVLAAVLRSRLKDNAADGASDVYAENEAHVLPGSFSAGIPGNQEKAPANLITLLLSKTVTAEEFQAAKASVAAARGKLGADDIWLDVDTFKLASAAEDQRMFDGVTQADVQRVAARFAASPTVSVIAIAATPATQAN